jgi:uncharacterized membrane protein
MGPQQTLTAPALRRYVIAVGVIAALTVVALIALWPTGEAPEVGAGLAGASEGARVISVTSEACPPPQPGTCREAVAELTSGPDDGDETTLLLGGSEQAPSLESGDSIRVTAVQTGAPAQGVVPPPDAPAYAFSDFERGSPMLWLAAAFIALVVVFGRLRGVLSLVGLAASLAIVLAFVVPAILREESPLAVALAGAMAVMLVTIPLAHGLGPKSLAAIVGTALSLLLVAGLAAAFTELTHLTGLSSEEATLLRLGGVEVDFQGLLLAGIVIGALGVLDDVTVSQASTVLALRSANPELARPHLYRAALVVGRDHLSATVNTLVLAYVGASLPILLIFASGEAGFGDAVNTELVAKEVVATLVGSIGLIAAVPLTTLVAATLAGRLDPAALEGAAGHAH